MTVDISKTATVLSYTQRRFAEARQIPCSQILAVIEDIKVLIKDQQYKTMLDDLIQNYNNNNNALLNNTPTTERDIEVKRITDEILTNVKIKVAEIKQQIR